MCLVEKDDRHELLDRRDVLFFFSTFFSTPFSIFFCQLLCFSLHLGYSGLFFRLGDINGSLLIRVLPCLFVRVRLSVFRLRWFEAPVFQECALAGTGKGLSAHTGHLSLHKRHLQ